MGIREMATWLLVPRLSVYDLGYCFTYSVYSFLPFATCTNLFYRLADLISWHWFFTYGVLVESTKNNLLDDSLLMQYQVSVATYWPSSVPRSCIPNYKSSTFFTFALCSLLAS